MAAIQTVGPWRQLPWVGDWNRSLRIVSNDRRCGFAVRKLPSVGIGDRTAELLHCAAVEALVDVGRYIRQCDQRGPERKAPFIFLRVSFLRVSTCQEARGWDRSTCGHADRRGDGSSGICHWPRAIAVASRIAPIDGSDPASVTFADGPGNCGRCDRPPRRNSRNRRNRRDRRSHNGWGRARSGRASGGRSSRAFT